MVPTREGAKEDANETDRDLALLLLLLLYGWPKLADDGFSKPLLSLLSYKAGEVWIAISFLLLVWTETDDDYNKTYVNN